MGIAPGQSDNRPLRPKILVELGRNVLLAEIFHTVQQQQRIDRLHAFEHAVPAAIAGDRIPLQAAEPAHHLRVSKAVDGALGYRVEPAAVDLQPQDFAQIRPLPEQCRQAFHEDCQIACG